MDDSLGNLERKRSALQTEISQLGDFRSGSITGTGGRCGNPRCHCHKEDDPGHGPYFRLTRKVNGKTVTETFSTPAELRKAQAEVAAYHRFRQLGEELLETNEEICRLRPASDTESSRQEKKRRKRSSEKRRGK